jgi:hypothetical protein
MFVQLADAESCESTAARAPLSDRSADDQLRPAKGIMTAMLLATPVWAAVAVSLYILL